MAEPLTADLFEPYVRTGFDITIGDGLTLALASVTRQPTRPHGERTEPFTLTFVGSSGDRLAQGTYSLDHPQLGTLDIFLVPIGPDRAGRRQYEAVFN